MKKKIGLHNIKICGLTLPEQCSEIADMGFGAIGFVLYPPSPRSINPDKAVEMIKTLPTFTQAFAVVVNMTLEEILAIRKQAPQIRFQLHGDENPEFCKQLTKHSVSWIKSLRVKDSINEAEVLSYPADTFLLDAYSKKAYGGTGQTLQWKKLAAFCANNKVILAGGLNPENFQEAWAQCGPASLDMSSGLESSPGLKDMNKIKKLKATILNQA